ncbi:store-operated calcium entry-associated regulatory factor-like [Myxocyprinus asiaticus]|uniref:store-operated calcium entry-associated regulatory factor-like n=1 Tax=Myxocyprinus asiaticus TaxID=70543 RepID=UPI0022236448|nr:store-operated calcium entry-associated regulatory factor-like [Myxocyprinus asiaticus]
MKSAGVLLLHILLVVPHIICWTNDAVLLQDVQVLTLYKGRYATARRSSPVQQLQCVGGSAGCGSFIPEVVQCYNKGSDGIDIQWECKADMDNAYRFGHVEVSCEGYSSPNDAYILKGSCGLEYTLELTAEGKQQHTHGSWGSSGFSGFASSFFQGFSNQKQRQSGGHYQQSNNHYPSQNGQSDDGVGGLMVVALFLLLAYGVYKMFLCSPTRGHQGYDGDPSQGFSGPWDNSHGMGPPPPGFKPDYTDHSSSRPGYGFSDSYTRPQNSWTGFTGGNSGTGGGGFWTGMGTGGVLGYLYGSQRRQPHMGSTGQSYFSRPSPPSQPTSSGTRTASGFGGTKRR